MEFLLDTADDAAIAKYKEIIPLAGVTTNPSIMKKEGKVDFFERLKKIKEIIGANRALHVQVVATTRDGIIKDAHRIIAELGKETYVKIPVTQEGLAAIRVLKKEGVRITATAIYTELQGYLAICAGADYLAPYYNRMLESNINAKEVLSYFVEAIARTGSKTQVLAASFHTVQQINEAIESGAQAVTVAPEFIEKGLENHLIMDAVSDFSSDWSQIHGAGSIVDL
ncbi:fructose-6-phosphate aldolase [Lactobacillus sp. ESL0791]|uniref:fructose-6-phosphate aldolase n=1 Tax=Lactobacillus sp. ESL0791 TaxID=2983234 RepID=UPI0023FA2E6D|nr:fructose-6-phosphate aldolase [Lactobacillus sp. ESL0791]MDF7638408.1 fructose-6-phosphate aldolase [Lactobacillus sp. ESL0791]